MPDKQLTLTDHGRDSAGMMYVYPVISRRAGGVSVGINLNPNNACNWQCVYCQVPNLVRGSAPDIDIPCLQYELRTMLTDIVQGTFMQDRVPEDYRQLQDIAISGNGEPTSCVQFDRIIGAIQVVMEEMGVLGKVPLRLITNGSYVSKPAVQAGLKLMHQHLGEVWIKVDRVTELGVQMTNGVSVSRQRLFDQVKITAGLCETWIQTCMFVRNGYPPDENEIKAYLRFLFDLKQADVRIQGVLLYGLARESMQPEGSALEPLSQAWMEQISERIQVQGTVVKVSI